MQQPLTDHHLKIISFIADIGNLIVVMARLSTESDSKSWSGKMPDFTPAKEKQEEKTTKVICHVLETEEVRSCGNLESVPLGETYLEERILRLVHAK